MKARAATSVAAIALALVAGPAALAQVDLPPLPPPPAPTEPVTDAAQPVVDPACGSIDGLVPTDLGAVVRAWTNAMCPPAAGDDPAPDDRDDEPADGSGGPREPSIDEEFGELTSPELVGDLIVPGAEEIAAGEPRADVVDVEPGAAVAAALPADAGFAYAAVLLLPLALLALGGYVGFVMTRPVGPSHR